MDHFICDLGKRRNTYFSILDLKSAFQQVPLSKVSQKICTFSSPMGCVRLKTCPFGLKNLPSVFTKLMDIIFIDIKNTYMTYYLDDVIIFSETFNDHLQHLNEVFSRLKKAKLTLQPEKTHLFMKSVVFLGVKISSDGIETEDRNITKVKNFPLKNTKRSIKGFLGLTSFYKKLIQNYSIIAAPLYELTKKQHDKVKLTSAAIDSFNILKQKLITAPLLTFPRLGPNDPPLTLTVDSSSIGVGFIMSQRTYSKEINKEIDKPIYYGSKNFSNAEQKQGSTELETLGITIALKKLETYLKGRSFNLITDHKALIYIMNKKLDDLKPSLARKVLFMSQYDFKLIHKNGLTILNADTLSRQQYEHPDNIAPNNEPELYTINQNQNTQKNEILDFKELNLNNMTEKSIRKNQKNDLFYRSMYEYLKHEKMPKDKTMMKRIQNNKHNYIIQNKLLYHLWKYKPNQFHHQLCIPTEFRTNIMQALHDLKTTGHAGSMKMYQSALTRIWWPKMYSDFENYVSSCDTCLQSNKGHYPKISLKPLPTPPSVFDTIHLDLLSVSTPSNGFKYMLVIRMLLKERCSLLLQIIDAFSKFIAVKCLKNKTARNISRAIFEIWFLRYGIPRQMSYACHDNGLEFVGNWTQCLFDIINVKSRRTTVYTPSSNSQAEITNRNILNILRRLTRQEPKKWHTYIPYVVMAINSTVSESTKFSPFFLMHGTRMLDIIDFQLPHVPNNVSKTKQQAYQYWLNQLTQIRQQAKINIDLAKERQKKAYDLHTKPHSFAIGDHVYVKIDHWKETDDSKLNNHYKGKYTIIGFQSDTNAILADAKGKPLPRSVYINKLKKCKIRKNLNTVKNDTHNSNTDTHTSNSDTDTSNYDTDNLNSDTVNSGSGTDNSYHDTDHSISDIDNFTHDTDTYIANTDKEDSDSSVSDTPENDKSDSEMDCTVSDTDTIIYDYDKDTADTATITNIMDNIPTEQYFNEDIATLITHDCIHKVYKKKIDRHGITHFYVTFKKDKKHKKRTWICESDMAPQLRRHAHNKKLHLTKQNIAMIQKTNEKNST